jgi:hypothetical protein
VTSVALVRREGRSGILTKLGGAVAIATVLAVLSGRSGGYFPTAWGWAALLFAWFVVLAVVLVADLAVSSAEAALVTAFGGLVAWICLSSLWSDSAPATLLECKRGLMYLTALAALVIVVRRATPAGVLGGLLAGITAVAAYGVATRLFPGKLGSYDPIATYRLAAPIGYWNGLGLFAVIGSLIAAGFVAHARVPVMRAAAAASLAILLPALYFTFSRGAWLALAISLSALVAIEARRLQFVAAVGTAAAAPAVAVGLASRSSALTTQGSWLSEATRQGHQLAGAIVALMAMAATLTGLFVTVQRRWAPNRLTRRMFAAALAAAVLGSVAAAMVVWGSPWHIAATGWSSFTSAPSSAATQSDLNRRLFQLSNNGRIVSWKSAIHEFEQAPVSGTGSGTFETWWLEDRPTSQQIRDAHSLYLETLGELGVTGLLLLSGFLVIAVVSGVRKRREPYAPIAVAAVVAWIVHAGVDWDWEIPAVTLPALACAVVCVAGAGRREWRPRMPARVGIAALAGGVALSSVVVVVGNQALASGREALETANYAKADSEARKAQRWAPWLSEPWIIRGQIEALNQDRPSAQADFRKAIAKDPRNYLAWYGLAGVTSGVDHRQAVTRVLELNPLSDEAKELRGGS